MNRYLVTGGAGFIGSHTVDMLVHQKQQVTVLDNFSSGKRENLSAVRDHIALIEGDIRDADLCRRAMKSIDVVIHLAALHEVPRSVENPVETHEVNVTGTVNLLVAARDSDVRRFVLASSSAVYGDSPIVPRSESIMPSADSSPYAASKLVGEQYCRLFSKLYGLETVAVRFFNVYGSRQSAGSAYAAVIPKFMDALVSGRRPTIYGDGEQSRDFTHVRDCVAATLAACQVSDISGEVINIGTGRRTTVNELCAMMQELLDADSPACYAPPLAGDIRDDQADIAKARRLLSYAPQVDLRQGLREIMTAAREPSTAITTSRARKRVATETRTT